jgi:hypothetical protein
MRPAHHRQHSQLLAFIGIRQSQTTVLLQQRSPGPTIVEAMAKSGSDVGAQGRLEVSEPSREHKTG